MQSRQAINMRKAREHRRQIGLCLTCGARASRKGKTECFACAEMRNNKKRNRRLENIRHGRCVRCGEPHGGSRKKTCETCLIASVMNGKQRAAIDPRNRPVAPVNYDHGNAWYLTFDAECPTRASLYK